MEDFKLCFEGKKFGRVFAQLYETVLMTGALEPDKRYDIILKDHRSRRSLTANGYCWALLDKLAAALSLPKEEIYASLIRSMGGNSDTVCVPDAAVQRLCRQWQGNGLGWLTDVFDSRIPGCKNVTLYYGSSAYDTKQMSRLIELVQQECIQQGIETATPAELERMMDDWRVRTEKKAAKEGETHEDK